MKKLILRLLGFESPEEYFERKPEAIIFVNSEGTIFSNPKRIDQIIRREIEKTH